MRRILAMICCAVMSAAAVWAQQRAVIPEYSVNLADFGGKADGISSNTEAFAKAVKALEKKGGGHLVVAEGLYLTGPIVLKDNMDLHIERGAVIVFSPDKSEFFDGKSVRPCITASKRHDVAISGEGIIDGNGEWWRAVKRSKVSDVEWKEFRKKGGTVTEDGSLWYPFGLKHYADIAPDSRAQEKMRTHLIRFTDCERVTVTGVTIQNSPKFHLVPQRCSDVVIDGVSVRCPWNAQNGDGIDITNCRRVLVTRCTVDVGDDGICLKGGSGARGVAAGPCKDITIEYNTVYHAHGGFVIGSDISGGAENIVVSHNVFAGTDTGLRFKSAPERGGKTSNIRISDILMTDIKDQAIVFETTYADRPAGYDGNQAALSTEYLPEFTDIVIERVTCRDAATAVRAGGTLQTVHDIVIRNSVFFYSEKALDEDVPGMVRTENTEFHTYR